MANFGGHAIPGTFFLLYSLWLAVKHTLRHHWRNSQPKGRHNVSKFLHRMEYLEGGCLIFAAFVGMMAEQFVVDGPHAHLYDQSSHSWVKLMNWQHSTMYLFFGIAGAVSVSAAACPSVPRGVERLALSLALFVEGFLFYHHLHGRPPLDAHVHTLLLAPVFAASAGAILEVFVRDNVILEVFGACLLFLQGSWFYQIGCVLYPLNGAQWDLMLHDNIMFTTMCFCWHLLLALVMVSGTSLSVCLTLKRCSGVKKDLEIGMKTTHSSQKALLEDMDED